MPMSNKTSRKFPKTAQTGFQRNCIAIDWNRKEWTTTSNLKFSAVFGTMSAKSSILIRPAGKLPMVTSKKTIGFLAFGCRKCHSTAAPPPAPAGAAIASRGTKGTIARAHAHSERRQYYSPSVGHNRASADRSVRARSCRC
jgi:hypothetical protein